MENTKFSTVYDNFFSKITDDMYMEMSREETEQDAEDIMLNALYLFEFPRNPIFDYSKELGQFNCELTPEEINIIGTYMVTEWAGRQIASIENTRMKYTGTDFKMTSQANHMQKLISLKKQYLSEGFHLQRLYGRRKSDNKGGRVSNWNRIMQTKEGEWNFVT